MKKIIFIGMLLVCSNGYAWDNERTHREISDVAANLSLSTEQLDKEYELNGKKQPLLDWMKDGSKLEDAGSFVTLSEARFRNHFHNPLANLTPPIGTLTDGGLTDKMTGQSTLFWAQDGANQLNHEGGDWSWKTVRDHYYRSLTTTSKVGIEMFTAMTYLGLGYQMHLVQDMAQPDHVRNDAHPVDGTGMFNFFETWAKAKYPLIRQYAATATKPAVDLTQSLYDGYAPVGRLMDTRRYVADRTPSAAMNQGLAEYTNANFFSDDTIFAARYATDDKHYFPYPRKEGTDIQSYFDGTKAPETVISEDGKTVNGLWISKTGEGETIPHLARVGAAAELAYAVFGEGNLFYTALGRDEITYDDYARLLVPRAVGYSAALLDYFFRGTMTVNAAPGDITFRSIKVTAQNSTPNEAMGTGEVSLVIRYKGLAETPLGGSRYLLNNPSADYSYKAVKLQNVDMTNPRELTFNFSADPLPTYFDDMTMQLVYRGPLGNESDAVAVSKLEPIDGIYTDFALSLPPSGVYAKSSDNSSSAHFNELRLTALTDIPGGLSGGTIELALEYREATSDPFQSLPVDTAPVDGAAYIIRVPEKNGITALPQGVPVELLFDLSSVPLPTYATDVYLTIVYKQAGTGGVTAIGYSDISEPTPVDIFNNTDYVCISNQWYPAGTPAALAAADAAGNQNGIYDDTDTYPHDFTDIYAKASAIDNSVRASASVFDFLYPGPLSPNNVKRMGYVLTDYAFTYSFLPNWVHTDPNDGWTRTEVAILNTGTAIKNQTDPDEVYRYPGMYNMRGKPMWWGAGIIYNAKFPAESSCSWDALPLP